MDETAIVPLPLDVTLELQKATTLGEAASIILKAVAVQVKESLGKPESVQLSANLDKWMKGLEACDKLLKGSLKKYCLDNGEVVSEAGSKKVELGGYVIPLTAKGKDSYDDKKVEALLRANAILPKVFMDESISYSCNKDTALLIQKYHPELFSALELCKKEITYALMPLKRVKNDE